MNAARTPDIIPPATYAALCDHLRMSVSTLSTTDAIVDAVQQWIAAERATAAPECGCQWKRLFLPDGTRVRMQHLGEWYYAEVVADQLIFRGQPVSPRQLTMVVTGNGRNAWRDLWLRRPGEQGWTCADRLRRELEHGAATTATAPPSPFEAMQAAASSMSRALQAALAVADHVRHQAEQATDRRIAKHRRREDFMIDDCKAD